MKKIFKYLFMLTVMFVLPNFVLAEETDTTYIAIDKNISLKYTVLGTDKPYTNTLDSTLTGIKLYRLDKNNSDIENELTIDSTSVEDNGSNYLIGSFPKYYEDGSEIKYLVKYTFNDKEYNKSITYTSSEYSLTSDNNELKNDGNILIKLQDTESFKTLAPKIVINKNLEVGTPDGKFAFKITDGNGNSKTVYVTTSGATSTNAGFGTETVYLDNVNTTYTIEEDISNSHELVATEQKVTYELESINSSKGTVSDKKVVTLTIDDVEEEVVINAKNKSIVEHSKTIKDNGDGTHQLSLDVTGENVKGSSKKANVVVIFDTSGSMSASTESGKYIYKYNSVNNNYWNSNISYFGLVDGDYKPLSLGYNNGYYIYYTENGNNILYTGQRYTRELVPETRLVAGQEAIKSLAGSLLSNNNLDDDDPNNDDIVLMSLVTFNTIASNPTTPTNLYSTIETAVNATSADGGTNWEDALQKAMNINFGANRDATTYYIFVSDGDPTFRNTNGNYNPMDNHYYDRYMVCNEWGRCWYEDGLGVYGNGNPTATIDGIEGSVTVSRCYENAKDEARIIVTGEKDKNDNVTREPAILYSIGAYGDVARMQNLANYAYTGNDNTAPQGKYYYDASDTDSLNQALKEILDAIERSGIGEVTIDDGTTNKITVETATGTEDRKLLSVDETSYQYWLTFPVTVKDGKNYIYVNDTEVEVNNSATTLTWGDNKTINITDSELYDEGTNKYFRYSWKAANEFYNIDPPEAKLINGSVKWVLSKDNVGLLLNGVKYSVTFNVWPSQYTYDLIADLNNGVQNYDTLPSEIQKYLINNNGSYILSTNTIAKLTYDDSRDEIGSRETFFVNPNPVDTDVSELSIEKKWINGLDKRKASSINIYLTQDENIYKEYTLDSSNDWKTNVSISTGLISFDEATKTAIIREVGHDYSFKESDEDAYNWDLVVDTVRPMIKNDTIIMLVKVSGISFDGNYYYDETTKKEYFKICDNPDDEDTCGIYVVSDNNNSILAKNYRRSNLNLTKAVDGDYDTDTLFEFRLTVDDANDHDVWFSIWDGTDYVLDTDNPTKYVSGATPEIIKETTGHITGIINNGDGTISYYEDGKLKTANLFKEINGSYYTGFYYAPSGSTITVRMKAGWNLRFTNLAIGTTYTFDEVLGTGYSFKEANLDTIVYDDEGNEKTKTKDKFSTTLVSNKEIDKYNTKYTVTYTNIADKTDNPVTARKVWEDNNNSYGKRPTSLKLNLLADGKPKYTVTINGTSSAWNYTWNNLAKYNAAGKEIVYTVTETAVNEGDLAYYIPVLNGLTITNYYNLRDITVTKVWGDDAKQAKVIVQLSSNRGYSDTKSINGTPSWSYTWTDLPIYYLDQTGARQEIIYSLSEISVNDITLENGIAYDYDTYIHSTIGKWMLVSIVGNANDGFTVTNDYKKYDYTLSFKKMSFTDYNNGKTNGLAGARFRLYKYIGEGVSLDTDDPLTNSDNWIVIDELTSDANGMMIFNKIYKDGELYLDGLYEGEYRLVEIEAPAGYVLCGGQWRLFIDLNKNTDVVSLRKFDKSTSVGRTTALDIDENGNIVVLNEEIPEIPTTGGIGIPHYDKYGLLLMLLSVAIFLFNIINQRRQIENI